MRSARPSRPWTATLALLLGIAALIPLSEGPEARAAEPAARRADVVPSPAARAGEPDAATHEGWWWPLQPEPEVIDGFEQPDSPYGPGHRGVDLAGVAGDRVRAVAEGVVTFAGEVAGIDAVTVDHGHVVSTYQPVTAVVPQGARVRAGEVIGHLVPGGSHCAPRSCLHLGRRFANAYEDPLTVLGRPTSRIRLMPPYGSPPTPPVASFGAAAADGALRRPVAGPVTSPFGMRLHPLTGEYKLHDGTDIAASCGTPVRAAADGQISERYFNAGYGNRLLIEHPGLGNGGVITTYNHLSRSTVRPGERIHRGEVIGHVGRTGLATGCHLHFMVTQHGAPVDPQDWL